MTYLARFGNTFTAGTGPAKRIPVTEQLAHLPHVAAGNLTDLALVEFAILQRASATGQPEAPEHVAVAGLAHGLLLYAPVSRVLPPHEDGPQTPRVYKPNGVHMSALIAYVRETPPHRSPQR